MFAKLAAIEARYQELDRLLVDPAVLSGDYAVVGEYAKERAQVEPIVEAFHTYQKLNAQLADARQLAEDESAGELRALAHEEVTSLEAQIAELETTLTALLIPKDPRDEKNVIVELRAGTGGDEAGLFAADLLRMYLRYAEAHGWKSEIVSQNESGIGGYKEVIVTVRGRGAYSRLKYESGVHRVQRVPVTEAQGRIHTSTTTVAVLAEVDDVDIELNDKDLKIDVYRSQGAGGQSVNTTDSAVRVTHLPTGIVVAVQDERKQLQNKIKALAILRARLYEIEMGRRMAEQDETRRTQVGSGERSEKIRTYNFPQNRVTDHRIGMTIYNLPAVLDGDLDGFIEQLALDEQAGKFNTALDESDESDA